MNKRILRSLILVMITAVLSVFLRKDAFATITVTDDQLYKLSILQNVERCYEKYAKDKITIGDFAGDWRNIFNSSMFSTSASTSEVWITTHVGNYRDTGIGGNDSDMTCEQVFNGYKDEMRGFWSYYEKVPDNLKGLGYVFSGETDSDYGQVKLSVSDIYDGTLNNSNKIIVKYIDDKPLVCSGVRGDKSGFVQPKYYWEIIGCSGGFELWYGNDRLLLIKFEDDDVEASAYEAVSNLGLRDSLMYGSVGTLKGHLGKISFSESMNESALYYTIRSTITSLAATKLEDPVIDMGFVPLVDSSNNYYVPYDNNKKLAAEVMLRTVGVDNTLPYRNTVFEDGAPRGITYYWSGNFQYALYYKYLLNLRKTYPEDVTINNCEQKDKPDGWGFKNTADTWCSININTAHVAVLAENSQYVVSVVDKSGNYLTEGRIKRVLEWFKKDSSYQYVTNYVDQSYNDDPSGADVPYSDTTHACYAGSGGLGWILCPIIGGISWIGEQMWSGMVQPSLEVPVVQLFGEDSGARDAWGIVRDIGNIVFVVLLLAVIFSQLTGVGIDNYGIKKMLPRLIIAAILMNVSYYICEAAIDVSDIVGSGVNALLSNLADDVASANGASLGAGISGFMFNAVLGTGVFSLFALLGGGAAVVGASLGLAVLGLIISMITSLFVLYLTLLVREAGVILCVVLAPVAIALYILPNTEKMYKKWFDIFKALLIVYPLCGALLGAGKFAGAILASGDATGMKVAAMLVQVLPYFLIPMLLRNSLSLLGNVGARISTMGRNLGRRSSGALQGGIRNSERFKDWQQSRMNAASVQRAERVRRRLTGRNNLSERQLERLRKAEDTVLADRKRRDENEARASGDYFDVMTNRQAVENVNEVNKIRAEREVGPTPALSYDNIVRRMENTVNETRADNAVPVFRVSEEAARQRRQAAVEAQEFKAFQDQLAVLSNSDLETMANNASSWITNANGTSQMRALINVMSSKGMEENVFDMLRNVNVGSNAAIMSELANSSNYLMKAYGKMGKDLSFSKFETGGALQKYIRENDIKNADKDSLKEINEHALRTTIGGVSSDTVDDKMLMSGILNAQVPKVREQLNGMMAKRIGNMRNGSLSELEEDLRKFDLNANDFATMDNGTAKKMLEAVKTRAGVDDSAARTILRRAFATQISGVNSNDQVKSKVKGDVADIFGIH